jgi:hypothetical protein
MIPAMIAANDATAVMVKESFMLKFRDLAQQGERITGESMRSTARMAISKGFITTTFIQHYHPDSFCSPYFGKA